MTKNFKAIDILLVDDSEDDRLIVKRVFKKVHTTNNLYAVPSGEEALDYLHHRGKYEERKPPAPGLILLDISMPGMNGFDVLEQLKADSNFKKIPVIMLTTSSEEGDIVRSYECGACSYITKPVNKDEFFKVLEQLNIYWTMVSKVP